MREKTRFRFYKVIKAEKAAAVILTAALLTAGCTEAKKVPQARYAGQKVESITAIVSQVPDLEFQGKYSDKILPGITCLGLDLSGMSKQEAADAIKSETASLLDNKQLTVTYLDQSVQYRAAELGYQIDADKMAEIAYSYGHSDDYPMGAQKTQEICAQGKDVALEASVDQDTLKAAVSQLASTIDRDPEDSKPSFVNGKFTFTDDVTGYKVNQDVAEARIEQALLQGDQGGLDSDQTVELPVTEIAPKVTKANLDTTYQVIGEYTTYYDASVTSREQNLKTASSKINGTILMPGDEFNYNQTVSPVTVENGYATANIIANGEYVLGIGGGLCQGSTTIYNAVIRAELEVTERWEHAYPAHYVPIGLDAMVYTEGAYNFRFVNDSGYPIYMEMQCGDGALTVRLYGHEIHDASRQVSWDSVVVETVPKPADKLVEDPTLKAGEKVLFESGEEGEIVDTYKTVTDNGQTTREFFTRSNYESSPDIYHVGPSNTSQPASEESSDKTTQDNTGDSTDGTANDSSNDSTNDSSGDAGTQQY